MGQPTQQRDRPPCRQKLYRPLRSSVAGLSAARRALRLASSSPRFNPPETRPETANHVSSLSTDIFVFLPSCSFYKKKARGVTTSGEAVIGQGKASEGLTLVVVFRDGDAWEICRDLLR